MGRVFASPSVRRMYTSAAPAQLVKSQAVNKQKSLEKRQAPWVESQLHTACVPQVCFLTSLGLLPLPPRAAGALMEGIYTKAWKSAQHAGSGFGTFSVEGQIVNIFSIATIPVARDQLCHCSVKAARGSTQRIPAAACQ